MAMAAGHVKWWSSNAFYPGSAKPIETAECHEVIGLDTTIFALFHVPLLKALRHGWETDGDGMGAAFGIPVACADFPPVQEMTLQILVSVIFGLTDAWQSGCSKCCCLTA